VAGAGVAVAAAGAAAGASVAALAAGAGVGAAAFALAAGAAAVVLLAGVCARAAGAIEIKPANAVNHKALLRRITTLSRLRIGKEVPSFPDSKKRRTSGAPSSSAASSSDAALPPSRIFALLSAGLRGAGGSTPEEEIRHAHARFPGIVRRHLG
jgi:hypothetical protein